MAIKRIDLFIIYFVRLLLISQGNVSSKYYCTVNQIVHGVQRSVESVRDKVVEGRVDAYCSMI